MRSAIKRGQWNSTAELQVPVARASGTGGQNGAVMEGGADAAIDRA
jgi:hypothetical protein